MRWEKDSADCATNSATYTAAKVPVDTLINAVPQIQEFANVKGVQALQIASESITDKGLLSIARQVNELVKQDDVNGGALGMMVEAKPYWFRQSVKCQTTNSEFNIEDIKGDSLPLVQIAYGSGSMLPVAYEAYAKAGVKVIVNAGTGNGSVPSYLVENLRNLRKEGMLIVRALRVQDGFVLRNAEKPDDEYDWVVAHDLNPQKARILTALALTKTNSTKELQRMFWQY